MHDSLADMSKVGCPTGNLTEQLKAAWDALKTAGGGQPNILIIHPSMKKNAALMAELEAASVNHGFSIQLSEPMQ
jgi:hypothetical protein